MPTLNPNKLKIGYVILVATHKPAIQTLQRKAGYGESSKWTHIAGWSLGGLDAVEANVGFYKEGDYLFGKPAENVLPADFDNPEVFEEVSGK